MLRNGTNAINLSVVRQREFARETKDQDHEKANPRSI
jgi:hypothetical protein